MTTVKCNRMSRLRGVEKSCEVTTFDTDGNESVYSGEVSKAIAP